MEIILIAIVAFLAVTLVLVLLLLFAKAKLTSSGPVKIDINDGDKVLEVAAGSTLLNTLGEQGIFLPSACGGKGACGQCKCQVVEGGGSIRPRRASSTVVRYSTTGVWAVRSRSRRT